MKHACLRPLPSFVTIAKVGATKVAAGTGPILRVFSAGYR